MTKEHTVVFQPSGARGKVPAGTHLRAAARSLGVEIESVCAENATCGKCRILVEEGRRGGITSAIDHVTPMGGAEEEFLTKRMRTWERMGLGSSANLPPSGRSRSNRRFVGTTSRWSRPRSSVPEVMSRGSRKPWLG
jgi:uncharacterized 2Fe-2S/4Fe-4S cluster protein (DUF4445 family)